MRAGNTLTQTKLLGGEARITHPPDTTDVLNNKGYFFSQLLFVKLNLQTHNPL